MNINTFRFTVYILWLLLAGFLLSVVQPDVLIAEEGDAGSASAVFLKLDPSARSAAYGSAYTARTSDPLATHFNPAGLSALNSTESMITHVNLMADVKYNHVSMATPFRESTWGGIGISATAVDYGELDERTINPRLNPSSSLGEFGASDLSLSGSYGWPINRYIRAGFTLKYIRQDIDDYDATTFSGDIGFKVHPPVEGLVIGGSVRNLAGDIKFIQEADPLPQTYRAGIYYYDDVRWG
ncbi:MAG: PorV/PorQ family protein, partial [bacterium]